MTIMVSEGSDCMSKSAGKIVPEMKRIRELRRRIIRWFQNNERDYPWRKISDPYRILIAEMMLQRTKADQVVGVYNRFFDIFRTPQDVSSSRRQKIERILWPLGLQWRMKNFKEVSKELTKSFGGKVPDNRQDLKRLPGVGDYAAGMVLSTAFHRSEWAVDSNVVRVFKRYFGIATSKEGRRDRHVVEMARVYSSGRRPREANLGLVDFSALVCLPRNPRCDICMLSKRCDYVSEIKRGKGIQQIEG